MQSTSTRTIFLPTISLALVLGAGLVLHPAIARAQSADANGQPAAPAAAATTAAAPGRGDCSSNSDDSNIQSGCAVTYELGDCPDNADDLGQGKTFTCSCPAHADPAPVYGTDVYTPDSGLCTAAVHAGALQHGAAGSVIVQIVASPPVFKGTTRNGIKSEVWPKPAAAAIQFAPAK
jgi:hypothetical protein